MSTAPVLLEADRVPVEDFAGRVLSAALAAVELLNVELGLRLGLYERLAACDSCTAKELAQAAGISDRYAREWLEQQASAAVLDVDSQDGGPDARRFRLPPAHAVVLLDRDDEAYSAPLAGTAPTFARVLPAVEEAFRTGGGVPYADYSIHDLQAAFTRPVFVHQLTRTWLSAVPEAYAALRSGRARVAELACGEGVAAVQIARAFPGVTVDGFDLDDASIAAARDEAGRAGVADRVRFEVSDASRAVLQGHYDLVLCIEAVHDVADPVGVLRTMRRLRGPGGTVLVVDERAAEEFCAEADELERLLYACSTLHCLPVGMVEKGSAATGALMRPSMLRQYALAAGFERVEVLAVEHPQFRLYRLEG